MTRCETKKRPALLDARHEKNRGVIFGGALPVHNRLPAPRTQQTQHAVVRYQWTFGPGTEALDFDQ